MPLTRKEIQRRYASHSVNPYDFITRARYEDKDGNMYEEIEPFEIYGMKAYDIADELDLPLLYEADGF